MPTMTIRDYWRHDGTLKDTVTYENGGGWPSAKEGRRELLKRWAKSGAKPFGPNGLEVPAGNLIFQRITFED